MAKIEVVTKGLGVKLNEVRKATKKATAIAQRQAAKKTETHVKRFVGKKTTLRRSDINPHVNTRIRQLIGSSVRVKHEREPAHHFSHTYTFPQGGGVVRETGRGAKVAKRGRFGLKVKYYKDKPAIFYSKAFRTQKVGGGRVFIQRKGKARKPTQAIYGVSVWGVAKKGLNVIAGFATETFRKRTEANKQRLLRRIR